MIVASFYYSDFSQADDHIVTIDKKNVTFETPSTDNDIIQPTETNANAGEPSTISTTSPTEIEKIENKTINIDSAFDHDIGRYFGKYIKLNDFTKFQLLENPWHPSNTYNFPFSLHSKGDLHRGFYFKYCVLFSDEYGFHQSSSELGKLVKKSLTSFAKLYGKDGYLTTHENSKYHKDAVQENRSRLRPTIETIILCGRQNILLRGHRDDGYVLEQNLKTIESVSSSIRSEDIEGEERRLSGKVLGHIVIDFCKKYTFELEKCVGIGTDNRAVMPSKINGTTLPLSRLLQSTKLDAVFAIDAFNDVTSVLQTKQENADSVFQQIFKKAQNMASKLDVEIIKPRIVKKSVYRANQLNLDSIPEVFYRISIYIPILDSDINDLQNYFSEDVLNSFDLRLLMPAIIDFKALKKSEEANKTKLIKLMKLSEIYGGILKNNAICLEAEYDVWPAKWNRVKMNNGRIPETALEVLDVCDVDMFPAIHTLIHILATLPVSVATAESSFSTLRRLKTWLRTRMVEDRLNGLALMHIHRNISIDIEQVIDRFAKNKNRKLDFVL
ncbi:hypothetical protein AGLY_003437 [Aphis glycines]|uniref:HAT C-terminal dimerisation domain-containing protein n=1 Tax=Aphis glycines TaxID=307491 RepID=A0A6G0U0J7_APHGL|nr:hypothetical protein AGLY_003437 [Aphis glycines]